MVFHSYVCVGELLKRGHIRHKDTGRRSACHSAESLLCLMFMNIIAWGPKVNTKQVVIWAENDQMQLFTKLSCTELQPRAVVMIQPWNVMRLSL